MNAVTNQSEQEGLLSELWDEEPRQPKPHSYFYHLEPIGIGTPFVESLTSYITRLAAAHCVYPSKLLVKEVAPLLGKCYAVYKQAEKTRLSTLFSTHSLGLNGTTTTAHDLVTALEELTWRSDLRFLTLLTWKNVFTFQNLMRETSAWCPVCFEDWRESGQTIYTPLLWAVKAVTICPIHRLKLQTHCLVASCGRSTTPLTRQVHPGYCRHCNHWLGSPLNLALQKSAISEEKEWEWQHWVATSIGELLAAAPQITAWPSHEQIYTNLVYYINELTGGNVKAFARLNQISYSVLKSWFHSGCSPQLSDLVQVCFCNGLSLVDLMTIPRKRIIGQALVKRSGKQNHQVDIEQVQSFLKAVVEKEDNKPHNMKEVARCLEYSRSSLFRCFPALTVAINYKYRLYKQAIKLRKLSDENIQVSSPTIQSYQPDFEKRQHALEAILADIESIPAPMSAIARQLGSFPAVLRSQFPDLCRSISTRYRAYKQSTRETKIQKLSEQVRQAMVELHEQGYYPSMRQVRKKLNNQWLFREPKIKAAWSDTLTVLKAEKKYSSFDELILEA